MAECSNSKTKRTNKKKLDNVVVLNLYAVIFPLEHKENFFQILHAVLFHTTKNYTEFIVTFLKWPWLQKDKKKNNNNEKAIHTILCTICEVIWRHTIALYESLSKFINATSVTHRDIWICTQASTDRIMTFALFLMQSFHMTSEDNVFGGSRQNCCMEKRWVKILFSWSMEKITSYRFGTTWRWVNNENISL